MPLKTPDFEQCSEKCCCFTFDEIQKVYECNNPCGDDPGVSDFSAECCDCPSFLKCGAYVSESGGAGVSRYCYGVQANTTILFKYDAINVKDKFVFSGVADYDTGFVSGTGSFSVPVSQGGTLIVTVSGPQSTLWSFNFFAKCNSNVIEP